MAAYRNKKYKGTRHSSAAFQIVRIVLIFIVVIYIWHTNPVDADHTNTFFIGLRYLEFFATIALETLMVGLFLISPLVFFISLTKRKNDPWDSASDPQDERKHRPFLLYADKFRRSGIKGMIIGTLLSIFMFAVGVLILYWLIIPEVQDIPIALTGSPTTLNAHVTESHWTSGKHPTWEFQFANRSFNTARPTLYAGEDAIVTFLPHSRYIIEYKHEKPE